MFSRKRAAKNQTNRLKHPYKFGTNLCKINYLGAVEAFFKATVFKNVLENFQPFLQAKTAAV